MGMEGHNIVDHEMVMSATKVQSQQNINYTNMGLAGRVNGDFPKGIYKGNVTLCLMSDGTTLEEPA
jgi:hypothetical protein